MKFQQNISFLALSVAVSQAAQQVSKFILLNLLYG
jgi:hypothetical protein